MKKISLFLSTLVLLISMQNMQSQSFEETNIPNLTTTPSASRSANFIDVNQDGWDDVFITNGPFGGQNNMLYLNNQNGTFTTVNADDIVLDNDRSDGASFADVDNDGDLDAFVVTFGANGVGKKNYFYRNIGNGNFSYEPNIAMGIPLTYSETATWIDANNDQNLDLYITNSVDELRNLYFENMGDGSFTENSSLEITNNERASRSVDWVDYNGNGQPDLFVSNEGNDRNELFRYNGPNDFTQITNLSFVSDFKNSSGSSWADIDNDGDYDLFIANYTNSGQANQLFINNNDGTFTEDIASQIASEATNSFGSTFGDVDNDGDLDLFVCNSYLNGQNNNFMYMNDGDGNFTLDTNSDLALYQGWTFGAAFGDYDNDGWLDVLLANTSNESESNALFHNTGSGNNWIKFNCQGTTSNYSAVGARVRIKATIDGNEVWQTRRISASSGYCSQNSYAVHFGLGDATDIEEMRVRWPSGSMEIFTNLNINTIHSIVEGDGVLGVEDVIDHKIVVYPNPAKDTLTIASDIFQDYASLDLSIYTMDGRRVVSKESHHNFDNHSKITTNISSLNTGLYFFSISNGSTEVVNGKFMKR